MQGLFSSGASYIPIVIALFGWPDDEDEDEDGTRVEYFDEDPADVEGSDLIQYVPSESLDSEASS